MTQSESLSLGPDHHLDFKEVVRIANREVKVKLSAKALQGVLASRKVIERIVQEGKIVYGVTTGFGSFKNKRISEKDVSALQKNLIRSHSVGVGPAFAPEFVRAILAVRINSLVQGYSGIRPEVIQLACGLLNKNIIPFVPSQGSVGSSGDLAPLSHIGLVLMGEGRAWHKGELLSGKKALSRAGLKPIDFRAKEGLAWNNGTSTMTGVSAIAVSKAEELLALADLACAMTLEAVAGTKNALNENIHRLRPHPGQITAARNIAAYISGSRLVDSKADRVQDSYSLRCSPQVHGAAREAFSYVHNVVECELNSVTDNPLVFSNPDRVISGGNFHGEPVAIAMDTLGIAIAEIANISERRTAKLLDASTNEGLPMFLVPPKKAGLHNGLMIAQYTAAALVSENKVLAHPASVDSIPTSANQEDHVSMGTIAARKAWEIVRNAENVLAIEFITAAQGINFRDRKKLGHGTKKAYNIIRKKIPFLDDDRELWKDVENMKTLFGELLAIVKK
jgi:histidine ammonia-lyase